MERTATPVTLREVCDEILAAGQPATVRCEPGDYPVFLRSGKVGFLAPVTFIYDGCISTGGTIAGAKNLTIQGGTWSSRVVASGFENVSLLNMRFPAGSGVQARSGKRLLVDGLYSVSSGAAVALDKVTDAVIRKCLIFDFSGNAAIGAYGGGDIRILDNVITGWRKVAKGVHPDAIQTANAQTGVVEVRGNTIIWAGQGIFLGGVPDRVVVRDNFIQVDAKNALTWKSREPSIIENNVLRKLHTGNPSTPQIVNYGLRQGLAPATPGGANRVLDETVMAP